MWQAKLLRESWKGKSLKMLSLRFKRSWGCMACPLIKTGICRWGAGQLPKRLLKICLGLGSMGGVSGTLGATR